MKCEYTYCIYNRNFTCLSDDISINASSMCEDCTIVFLPSEQRERLKAEQLAEIASRPREPETQDLP